MTTSPQLEVVLAVELVGEDVAEVTAAKEVEVVTLEVVVVVAVSVRL